MGKSSIGSLLKNNHKKRNAYGTKQKWDQLPSRKFKFKFK